MRIQRTGRMRPCNRCRWPAIPRTLVYLRWWCSSQRCWRRSARQCLWFSRSKSPCTWFRRYQDRLQRHGTRRRGICEYRVSNPQIEYLSSARIGKSRTNPALQPNLSFWMRLGTIVVMNRLTAYASIFISYKEFQQSIPRVDSVI